MSRSFADENFSRIILEELERLENVTTDEEHHDFFLHILDFLFNKNSSRVNRGVVSPMILYIK